MTTSGDVKTDTGVDLIGTEIKAGADLKSGKVGKSSSASSALGNNQIANLLKTIVGKPGAQAPSPAAGDDDDNEGDIEEDETTKKASVLLIPLKSGKFLKRVVTPDNKSYRFICQMVNNEVSCENGF